MLAGSLGGIPLVQHLLATQVFSSNYSSNHYSNYYRMPGRLETFHPGEASMREVMHIPAGENPTAVGLPGPYAARVEASAAGIWRATANISAIACSAVVIESGAARGGSRRPSHPACWESAPRSTPGTIPCTRRCGGTRARREASCSRATGRASW